MITVNGQEAEPGCYIAGHHGQYGIDMLGDIVEQFDLEFGAINERRDIVCAVTLDVRDDPRFWRRAAEAESMEEATTILNSNGFGSHIARPDECWENQVWAADRCEEILNEVTVGGYWSWEDGEFFLTATQADGWMYVIAPDYEEAWELISTGVDAAIYASEYQAIELAHDAGEGDKVFQFAITVHYDQFAGTRQPLGEED